MDQTYSFAYDSFGNVTSMKVGTRTLASYQYGPNNGLLLSQTYGNGDIVAFTYDTLGRVKTTTYSTKQYPKITGPSAYADGPAFIFARLPLKNRLPQRGSAWLTGRGTIRAEGSALSSAIRRRSGKPPRGRFWRADVPQSAPTMGVECKKHHKTRQKHRRSHKDVVNIRSLRKLWHFSRKSYRRKAVFML